MTGLPGAARRHAASTPSCTWSATRSTTTGRPGFHGGCGPRCESPPGVVWHGGHPRAGGHAARRPAATSGCRWRHPELDASLELSTKVLEFGALGLPVVLNRTPMHEALLGADYPLFAGSLSTTSSTSPAAARRRPGGVRAGRRPLPDAAARLHPGPRPPTGCAATCARPFPDRRPPAATGGDTPPAQVVVAGHDLKFFTRLLEHLRLAAGPGGPRRPVAGARQARPGGEPRTRRLGRRGGLRVVRAERGLVQHGTSGAGSAAASSACTGSSCTARWPGPARHRRRRPGGLRQPALRAADPRDAPAGPPTRSPSSRTGSTTRQFDRAKLPGARYHLGMIGIAPSRKRLDLALDVLEELRRDDPTVQLFVKSKHALGALVDLEQPGGAGALRRRCSAGSSRSPLLRGAVVFDHAGPDVAVLAAPGRLRAVHQRRRELPPGPGRGHGLRRGAGAAGLAGRGHDLRPALDPADPGRDGRRDRRSRPRTTAPGGPPGRTPGTAPPSTWTDARAWHGLLTATCPGGARAGLQARRDRLIPGACVLHARDQRGHAAAARR